MDKIEKKLDKIDDRLNSIDQHLAVYNEQLAHHIKRTELLEKQVSPIKQHVDELRGAGKLIAILALIATVTATIIMIIK